MRKIFLFNSLNIFLLATLALAAPLSYSEPVQNSSFSNERERITLALDNADIIELIRWASNVTNKNIILHPNIKGRVTVLAGAPMNKQEAYDVFLSVLEVNELTVINEGDSLKIIPLATARTAALESADNIPLQTKDMVVKVIKVQNISASTLLNVLRPLIPKSGYLAAYPDTNMLIIAEHVDKIDQITNIIQRLDTIGVVDIELIPLKFASARDLNDIINKLLNRKNNNKSTSSFNIAVDERSNSLLITGDPLTRQQVRTLVGRLDQPLQGQGNTQVIRIQYADAKELVPLLLSVSGSVRSNEKDAEFEDIQVNIEPHQQLNALVITAPPTTLETMKGVIAELDKPRSQVLVEALIVEVNEELANNIGINWRTNPIGDSGSDLFAGFRSFPGGLNPLERGDITDISRPILGSGLSLGFFRSGDLRAVINALEGESDANILATPTILTLDNEEASILVGSNVPFITGSQQRPGDISPFQTIERHDIGLTLVVTPRINNHNSVTLDIEQKVESITQSVAETADIVTNKREIKTSVLIGNDQILVLGGLIRDEYEETESKVPLLGDIPWLGRLFKSTSIETVKANLMVFIHPKIIQTPDDLHNISKERYQGMRKLQGDFGNNTNQFMIMKNAPMLPELHDKVDLPAITDGNKAQGR